jgi:hypothetical protein
MGFSRTFANANHAHRKACLKWLGEQSATFGNQAEEEKRQ